MIETTIARFACDDAASDAGQARAVYETLYQDDAHETGHELCCDFLETCLEQVNDLPCDLPQNPSGLGQWMAQRHETVGLQYLDYLQQREAGAPRRYFTNRSHALYFLRGVAPTKLVDGAWLYGLLNQWRDDRYRGLIRIYLEELGDGAAADNHVAMYRRLLASTGCEPLASLDDEHYVQGAIQLCLARNAAHYVPEIIGFNLGYEQLPLHLLITAYELKELGIDHYYFQVHVTVDNADSGHARKAVDAVALLRPIAGDAHAYYQRIRRGYRLNELGKGTVSVIESFDIDDEMARIVAQKAVHGRHMHSNRCRVAGRTINSWLSDATDASAFLTELQRTGWIKRHCDPGQSRFWRLLDQGADMFGVFSGYEKQLIHDWIWGDALPEPSQASPALATKHSRGLLKTMSPASLDPFDAGLSSGAVGDFGADLRELEERFVQAKDRHGLISELISMLGPSVHHTPAGLMATRMFSRILDSA